MTDISSFVRITFVSFAMLSLAQPSSAFTLDRQTPLLSATTIMTRGPSSALAAQRPRRRNPNNSSSGGVGRDDADVEIPQLPSFGASSYDATAAVSRKFANQEQPKVAFVSKKFELQYTCKVCDTRNVHKVSRIAYNKGVVITVCKGCMSQHLISDNLGFTQQFDGNLEEYLKEQGLEENVQRVSEDVFNLEKILGVDTKSGSILGPDGTSHME